MSRSAIVAAVVLVCGTAVAQAQTDQQKQQRTHQSIQTGIANTPVASPPRVSTGTASAPFNGYTTTKTYPSPVQSGGGASTSHNYYRPPSVPSPTTSGGSSSSLSVSKSTTTTTSSSKSTSAPK